MQAHHSSQVAPARKSSKTDAVSQQPDAAWSLASGHACVPLKALRQILQPLAAVLTAAASSNAAAFRWHVGL